MTGSVMMYNSKVSICDLNDECLYEVFDSLTLPEKFGVQRVRRQWRRVTNDVIAGEERLELFMLNQTPYGKPVGYSHAYYSAELEEFVKTGVIEDGVKGLFQKFADNIKYLDITESTIPVADEVSRIKLNKAVFGQILALFKNLKSLRLFGLEIEGTNWNALGKFAQKIESVVFEALKTNQELISFAQTCKKLTSFEEKVEYLFEEELDTFESLEEINLKVYNNKELQCILEAHPRLTKLTAFVYKDHLGEHHLRDIKYFWCLFESFAKMKSLKQIDIKYKVFGFGLQATSHILSQVESLSLYDIFLTLVNVDDMKILARQFPSLKSFVLLGFRLSSSRSPNFENAVEEFLDTITTLTSLNTLFLEYKLPSPQDRRNAAENFSKMERFPSRILPAFLNAEKLSNLRRLSCTCFDIDDCFKAFSDLARNNPKQSYAFKEFDKYYPPMKLSEEVRALKPRNLFFF